MQYLPSLDETIAAKVTALVFCTKRFGSSLLLRCRDGDRDAGVFVGGAQDQ